MGGGLSSRQMKHAIGTFLISGISELPELSMRFCRVYSWIF
jgi:hypothetical protein